MTEGAGPVELEAGELRSRSFVLTEKVARGTFGTVYKVADKQVPHYFSSINQAPIDHSEQIFPSTQRRAIALCRPARRWQ